MHIVRLDTVIVRYLLDRGIESFYQEGASSDSSWAEVYERQEALAVLLRQHWIRSPYQLFSITAPSDEHLEILVEFNNMHSAQQFRKLVSEELTTGIKEFLTIGKA